MQYSKQHICIQENIYKTSHSKSFKLFQNKIRLTMIFFFFLIIYHVYHLIGYSISNSLALFGPVPLGVLNESIQTLLTETGTPCHSPTFSRNHLGGGFFPHRAPSLWTQLSVYFKELNHWVSAFKSKHEAHFISQKPTVFHNNYLAINSFSPSFHPPGDPSEVHL